MATTTTPPKQPEGNPALRAMGLPRLRAKLPSRNWTIFLTITGTFLGTVAYDRYQTKLIKRKWTSLVAPLAAEPLSPMALPRKITVYLAAPPGDGIAPAREHFRDYVKPVLNAAAVDFEVVEGKQMGELRAKVAEEVRVKRRGEEGVGDPVAEVRRNAGVAPVEGERGVLVVGRAAWKEYVRGLHEGWLGPLHAPEIVKAGTKTEAAAPVVETIADAAAPADDTPLNDDGTAPAPAEAADKEPEKPKDPEPEPEKPKFAPETILPAAYAAAPLPSDLPPHLPAAGIVPFPHLLGVLNTPVRLYRFVTRRHMADAVCREAAAVALATHRPFITTPAPEGTMIADLDVEKALAEPEHVVGEIDALKHEEGDWVKRVWKEERYDGVWRDAVTVDQRLGARMRRFFVSSVDEPREVETTVWREVFGWGVPKKEVKKVIIDVNPEDEDLS
ncbi:TIM complex component Tim54 [Geopyxis carbonaria]|nr:TIM complex component Tim54 [Geopyxis carbonaria]